MNQIIHTIINNYIFTTKLVYTPHDIQQGMMNSRFGKDFDSMLFVFPKENSEPTAYDDADVYIMMQYDSIVNVRKNYHCFWMKNCIIPLDMIFIKNNIVQQVHHSSEPCSIGKECETYCGFADFVLEVDGGTCKRCGISIGSIVKFTK
jgi:hypothetical protein